MANDPITSGVPCTVPSLDPFRQGGKSMNVNTGLSNPMTLNCVV